MASAGVLSIQRLRAAVLSMAIFSALLNRIEQVAVLVAPALSSSSGPRRAAERILLAGFLQTTATS